MPSYVQDARGGSPPASLSPASSPESYYNPLEAPLAKTSTIIPRRSAQSMAAIHALPIEILSRVFLLGLPDGEYPDFPPPPPNANAFEVAVSHVCQHWRHVALRIPALWGIVHLRTVPHIDRARQYLCRSARAPLHILVDTCDSEEHVPGFLLFRDEFLPVFALLTPHIARWRSLQIKVRDRQCKLGARQVLSTCGPAPALEFLQLWHVETWETSERLFTQIGPPPVVVFNKALPALRRIALVGVNLPWAHAPFLAGLADIEFGLHAHDVRMPYALWERMLARSPALRRLALHYSGPRGAPAAWPPRAVRLPALRELVLAEMPPAALVPLVRRLRAPRLAVLRLNLPSLEDDGDCTPFLEHLAAPPPPLPVLARAEDDDADEGEGEDAEARARRRREEREDAEREREEKEKAQDAPGPVFRALDALVLDALDCSAESFARFLRAAPSVTRLELDGRKLGAGLFEELMRVVPAPAAAEPEPEPEQAERQDGAARAGSSDASDTGSGSADSASTARTTPASVPPSVPPASTTASPSASPPTAPAPASTPPTPPTPPIPLPHLHTLRITGVPAGALAALVAFRRAHGAPVRRWRVGELMRCPALERLAAEMEADGEGAGGEEGGGERIVWEEEEEGEEEDEEEDEGESGEEGYVYEDEEGEGEDGDGEGEGEAGVLEEPQQKDDAHREPAQPAHAGPAPAAGDAACALEEDACCNDEDDEDDDAEASEEDEAEEE